MTTEAPIFTAFCTKCQRALTTEELVPATRSTRFGDYPTVACPCGATYTTGLAEFIQCEGCGGYFLDIALDEKNSKCASCRPEEEEKPDPYDHIKPSAYDIAVGCD